MLHRTRARHLSHGRLLALATFGLLGQGVVSCYDLTLPERLPRGFAGDAGESSQAGSPNGSASAGRNSSDDQAGNAGATRLTSAGSLGRSGSAGMASRGGDAG